MQDQYLKSIDALAVSYDGKTIVVGGSDKKINLWDARAGKTLAL